MGFDAGLTATPSGRTVQFRFRVTNEDTEPVELTVTSSQLGDVIVRRDRSGETEPVWRWSDGRAFTQVMTTNRLGPGETIEQTFTWAEPTPGDYEAVARLAADREVSARTRFEV